MMHGVMRDSPVAGGAKRAVRKPRHHAKSGKYTPGMCIGAIIIVTIASLGVSIANWWTWGIAVLISILIDAALGFWAVDEEKVKTQRRYERRY